MALKTKAYKKAMAKIDVTIWTSKLCFAMCKNTAPCSMHVFCGMQVNIGGGVLVETTLLERLHSHCQGPTKFARHLLRSIFTVEEMRGKSLFGKGSNANKNAVVKEALDPVRVNAVIGK